MLKRTALPLVLALFLSLPLYAQNGSVQYWIGVLENANALTWQQAAVALGAEGASAKEALPLLVIGLSHPLEAVHTSSSAAMRAIDERGAVETAIEFLPAVSDDRKAEQRIWDFIASFSFGKRSLQNALQADDPDVVLGAVNALSYFRRTTGEAVSSVARVARTSPKHEVRERAAHVLANYAEHFPEAADRLVEMSRSEEAEIRRVALTAFGRLYETRREAASAALPERLTDGDPQVARLAGRLARQHPDLRLVPAWIQVIEQDTAHNNRTFAFASLAEAGEAAAPALPHVESYLEDESEYVRMYAALIVANVDPSRTDVLPILEQQLEGMSPGNVYYARVAAAVKRLRKTGARPFPSDLTDTPQGEYVVVLDGPWSSVTGDAGDWDDGSVIARLSKHSTVDVLERVVYETHLGEVTARCRVVSYDEPQVRGWMMCEHLQEW